MRRSWNGALVLSVIAIVACGGGEVAAPVTAAPPAAAARQVPGAARLGHFTSADGMVLLVLDRTGDRPKIQLDGSSDIIELTPDEVRSRGNGELLGHAFLAPDGKRMLFVGVRGDLLYIKGDRDELPLVRDGDARPLGKATISGAPPGPKPRERSPQEIFAAELAAIAVTTRFPQLKPEDAGDLAKVGEAYQLAQKDMLVHCAKHCGAWYAPHPLPDGKGGLGFVREKDMRQGPATEEEKKSPLARYNAWLRADYEFGEWTHQVVKSSWLTVLQHEFKTLQENAPVLVWNVEGTDVFVVTLDGSRYWDSPADNNGNPVFVKGVPPEGEWPAPLRNNLLFREHVAEMGKRGLVDEELAGELEGIYARWGECAKKVFVPAQKELEGNLTNSAHDRSASTRNNLVRRKYDARAMKECGGQRAEQILAGMLAKRDKDQRALHDKNKARLLSLAR